MTRSQWASPVRGGTAEEWRAEGRGEWRAEGRWELSTETREEGEDSFAERKEPADGFARGLRDVPKARERVKSVMACFEWGGGMAVDEMDDAGVGKERRIGLMKKKKLIKETVVSFWAFDFGCVVAGAGANLGSSEAVCLLWCHAEVVQASGLAAVGVCLFETRERGERWRGGSRSKKQKAKGRVGQWARGGRLSSKDRRSAPAQSNQRDGNKL